MGRWASRDSGRLAGLYQFRAQFGQTRNTFVKLKPTARALQDAKWWLSRLSLDFCGRTIQVIPPEEDIQLFVDASSSWGIGLVVGERWRAWRLAEDWKSEGRDIGWAEMVAVELAVRWLAELGFQGRHVLIRSDNAGVVGALKAGFSRSTQQNRVLQRIVEKLLEEQFWVSTIWVASADNLADGPSRGKGLAGGQMQAEGGQINLFLTRHSTATRMTQNPPVAQFDKKKARIWNTGLPQILR